MTTDYEKYLAVKKERDELYDDRAALRRKLNNLRRDLKLSQEKAQMYADALLKLTGGPADEKVGRAWLADLGISGGDG